MPTTTIKQRATKWRTTLVHFPTADPKMIAHVCIDPPTSERAGAQFDQIISRLSLIYAKKPDDILACARAAAIESYKHFLREQGIEFDEDTADKAAAEPSKVMHALMDPDER